MFPPGVNIRITLSPVSATYTFPAESTATPRGALSLAEVASPPSPQVFRPVHWTPLPATVVIIPLDEILRISSSPVSATNTFPAPSAATEPGPLSCAAIAAMPSPHVGAAPDAVPQATPLPAIVEIETPADDAAVAPKGTLARPATDRTATTRLGPPFTPNLPAASLPQGSGS